MDRIHLLEPVLAQGVLGVGVHSHRPGTVERDDGGDVLEVRRLQLLEQGAHRPAIQLEHPEGLAAGQQVVRRLIRIEVEFLDLQGGTRVRFDHAQGILDDGQVAQAEEVHLQQTEVFERRLVELGDDGAVILTTHDRQHVDQGLGRHEHAGRVHAPLALEVLDAPGSLEHASGLGISLDERPKIGRLLVALRLLVEHVAE